jgi:hypothetical protein
LFLSIGNSDCLTKRMITRYKHKEFEVTKLKNGGLGC